MQRTRSIQRGARGFTVIELAVVVSVVVLLIAFLLPSLSKARDAAKSKVCMVNQAQVYTAVYHSMRDPKRINKVMNNSEWCALAVESLSDTQQMLCPADTIPHIGYDDYRFFTQAYKYYIPLADGPRAKRLATLKGGGYRLGLEDNRNLKGGDFNDVVVDVTFDKYNTTLKVYSSETADKIHLVNGQNVMIWDNLQKRKGQSFKLKGSLVSYGMNSAFRASDFSSQKIMLLDYEKSMANVVKGLTIDDWDTWKVKGRYTFARHPGPQINAAMGDGSVQSFHPDQLDPDIAGNTAQYWKPKY